ncbi:MAG: gliding motility-associated ABC transporter permease subunit GldF [Spirosomataceae bacterium]
MLTIFRKEINSFLNSLIAYIAIGVFLAITGYFVWISNDGQTQNVLDYGFADLNTFFSVTPFVFILLIPAITMRAFSEEFKTGTIELLLTKPLSEWQLVIGKFLAAFALVIVALIPTLLYYYSVYQLGVPKGNIDTAAVIGSYIGLILLGGVFVSIGIWSSSMTDNQVVAFILGAVLCFVFYYIIGSLASVFSGSLQYITSYIGLNYHYDALGRGLIDSRNVLYFLSLIFVALYLTKLRLNRKK